jgi:hypothetical protein
MLFSKEDFKVNKPEDVLDVAMIGLFLALVAPLIIAAYTLGFVMDRVGWLKTST